MALINERLFFPPKEAKYNAKMIIKETQIWDAAHNYEPQKVKVLNLGRAIRIQQCLCQKKDKKLIIVQDFKSA